MRKIIVGAVIFVMLGIIVFQGWQQSRVPDTGKPVVRIGVTLPLTGNTAFAGVPAQKAILNALEDMQAEKDLKYTYELIFESDGLNAKQGFLNASRLVSLNKARAILSMWGIGYVLTDWANQNQILHFGCSWGYETGRGLYNFNVCTFPDEQTPVLVRELQKRNIRKIGFIHNGTQTDEQVIRHALPALEKAGIKVAFNHSVHMTERDFRMLIYKMKRQQADILMVLLTSPGLEIFARQMKDAGYRIPLTSYDYFAFFPAYFEGQWFIASGDGTERFLEDFKRRNGMEAQSCSPNLYDALRLLIEGFETAPAPAGEIPDNEAVARAILNIREYSGALGPVSMDDDGNVHVRPIVRQIKNGQVVPVDE